MSIDHDLIDKCSVYIESKDSSYLAQEGQIVYYENVTSRKQDNVWQKQTVAEVLRIIKAMHLSMEMATKLKEVHLITAFQELGRVYEFGTKTRHAVREGVFNFSQHASTNLIDEAFSMMVAYLQSDGYTALLMGQVAQLMTAIQFALKIDVPHYEQRDLMFKHFEAAGFVMKTGAHRPLIDRRKQPAIMMVGTKPSQVVDISGEWSINFAKRIKENLL